jgi:MbtH protein
MSSPFEIDGNPYRVLANDEGQHSLWPASMDIPAGWTSQYGPAERAACLEYVESHWTDMRPKGLVAAMAGNE